MQSVTEIGTENQRARLNRLYRFQRHFYDLTRATFLFGRDRLLEKIADENPAGRILEVGCGTGRNLIGLARLAPNAKIFGLDAADEMLRTADRKIFMAGLRPRVNLRQAYAEEFGFQTTFKLDEPFDAIFISYSLSMFPQWRAALDNALENLRANGKLYIVDFWDGGNLPGWLMNLRTWWLGLFHVSYRPEFLRYLEKLEQTGAGKLGVAEVWRRYAFIADFRKH